MRPQIDEKQALPVMSDNLLTGAETWASAGWTGSAETGWTHTSGNTNPLTLTFVPEIGESYVVEFDANTDIASQALTVSLGGSTPYDLYWAGMSLHYAVGAVALIADGISFNPQTNYTGMISNITVKKVIAPRLPAKILYDENGVPTAMMYAGNGGNEAVYIGIRSGENDGFGYANTAIGYEAMKKNISGFWNVALGKWALRDNISGARNVALGRHALVENVSGHRNVAVGSAALQKNTTGRQNIAIGCDAMFKNTTGESNVAIGFNSLLRNKSGIRNIGIGENVMQDNTSGESNVAIGYNALNQATVPKGNVAIGSGAMFYATVAENNMAIGANALYRNNNGKYNTAIGANAARGKTVGKYDYNVVVGDQSAINIIDGCQRNVVIGAAAAATLAAGTYNIVIGHGCDIPKDGNYQLNIGNLIIGAMQEGKRQATINGKLKVTDLPTSDPGEAGVLWNDGGSIKVSAG